MGMPMTLPALLADGRAQPVTPLMAFLAGAHADLAARIWPAPHEDFLLLPAARRHAAILLALRGGYTAQRLQWLASRARDGELAAEIFGDHPPGGVMKALGRMGEILWAGEAYPVFIDLFREEAARQLIRHMPALHPEVLTIISLLPVRLRQATVVSLLGTERRAAADLAAAYAMALRVRGEAAAGDIVQRFGRAKTWAALFETAVQVIQPLVLAPVVAPPELPGPFVPVRCFEMLSKTALEFRNCLRDYTADLASGRMAVWIWRGEGGPAAIALRRDAAGWRLAEARGRDNAELPDAALMEVVAAVRAAGVRTGEAWPILYRRLEDRVHEDPSGRPAESPPSWRDQLCLGYLWD